MSLTASNANHSQAISIQTLLEEANQDSLEARKDTKLARAIHHEKNMALLDKNISALQKQQNALGKAGTFNFFIGICSNFFNIGTLALSLALPPLAPVFQAANQGIQGVINSVSQLNPYTKEAGQAGVNAEKFKKWAEVENFQTSIEEEHLKSMTESQQTFKNRMEKALENMERSEETVLKV